MAETVESFVAKLRAEGVEAGRQAAEKIKAEAEAAAAETLRRAAEQAAGIVAQAEKRAADALARGKTDLALAARDAVLGLKQALNAVLAEILAGPVRAELGHAGFLKELIHAVATEYAKADREAQTALRINVRPEMRAKLADWALQEARAAAAARHPRVDLRGTLAQAGFELRVADGTVEVTEEAVLETLRGLAAASLSEIFDAMSSGGKR
ncbi:MAG TPA: hypothetical protein PKX48_10355 [Planctomycetota bacterium]|jgi:V/A-type H+-transporting ATPase subunit E|nr:hypothetical protein [Planctomycetota bacterium]OQC21712.1 MAG: V-type ATP synthase subunit E [Planctomycetes bacterium ADurb.Bin069]HNR98908.1 hypothetical protein [Planctomycetota bacterium]HNU26017.1 hypothetical protein [Planctomycetota bacterium]HOE29682.1 hypothetical protein [Planctomycetota bacterium]